MKPINYCNVFFLPDRFLLWGGEACEAEETGPHRSFKNAFESQTNEINESGLEAPEGSAGFYRLLIKSSHTTLDGFSNQHHNRDILSFVPTHLHKDDAAQL